MRDLNRLIKKVNNNGASLQAIIFNNCDVKLNYVIKGAFVDIQQSCFLNSISEAYNKIGELIDRYRIPELNCTVIEFAGEAELNE